MLCCNFSCKLLIKYGSVKLLNISFSIYLERNQFDLRISINHSFWSLIFKLFIFTSNIFIISLIWLKRNGKIRTIQESKNKINKIYATAIATHLLNLIRWNISTTASIAIDTIYAVRIRYNTSKDLNKIYHKKTSNIPINQNFMKCLLVIIISFLSFFSSSWRDWICFSSFFISSSCFLSVGESDVRIFFPRLKILSKTFINTWIKR